VNQVSGSYLKVGDNLESCTSDIQVSEEFMLDGRRVMLIDTPGFDDTNKSDTDVLKSIAAFLGES
jgi:predicted GTPase